VIQRLLDYSESYYCITRLPEEPKAEEGNPP